MKSNNHRMLMAVLFVLLTVSGVSAQVTFAQTIRPSMPEIGLLGYGSYAIVRDTISVVDGTNIDTSFSLCMLASDGMLAGASVTAYYANVFADSSARDKILWTARAIYLGSILPAILWSLFDANAEGEDRLAIGLYSAVPGLVGFAFTFLPYPNR